MKLVLEKTGKLIITYSVLPIRTVPQNHKIVDEGKFLMKEFQVINAKRMAIRMSSFCKP